MHTTPRRKAAALFTAALLAAACHNGAHLEDLTAETQPAEGEARPTITVSVTDSAATPRKRPARITAAAAPSGRIDYSWQEGDVIKCYLRQGGAWLPVVEHRIQPGDMEDGRLVHFTIETPEGFAAGQPYDIYGCAGGRGDGARYDTAAEGDPVLRCANGAWTADPAELAKDVVVTFAKGAQTTNNPEVAITHAGNILAHGIYSADRLTPSSIGWTELGGKQWCYDGDGNPQSAFRGVMAAATTISSDSRQTLFCWVHTIGGAAGLSLQPSLRTHDGTEATLAAKASLPQVKKGNILKVDFDSWKNAVWTTPRRTVSDNAAWRKRWMTALPDNMPLHDLLIPGTHDSAADEAYGWAVLAPQATKTQNRDIPAQLAGGVRALDIRVNGGADMYVVHGDVQVGGHVEDVALNPVRDFLRDNPGETVILLFKSDTGGYTEPYMSNALSIFAKYLDYLYTGDLSTARIGDLRGKMVVLTRNRVNGFYGGADFTNWGDKEPYRTAYMVQYKYNNSVEAQVQDRYKSNDNQKKTDFTYLLDRSEENYRAGRWIFNYLSFGSDTNALYSLYSIARNMNPWAETLISQRAERQRGIVFMDFACDDDVRGQGLVDAVISNNYKPAQ